MTVEEAAGSLKAHEERVKCKTESSGGQLLLYEEEWSKRENDENKLLLTREEWQRRTNKSDLDTSGSQRRRGGRDKSKFQCYHCGIFGHYTAECRKPKKNEERRQEVNMALVKDEEPALLLAKCDKEEEIMTLLNEKKVIPTLKIDDTKGQVESNMWKIISLGQMSESSNEVTMKGEYLWVFDKKKKLLMKVKRSQNRLYELLNETTKPSCLMSKSNEITRLWHIRLEHVNYKAMYLMYKGHMVKAKQTRKRFPSQSNYSATQVLDLVHGDLCGPVLPDTASRNKYFFLFVDDYSRYSGHTY
ncbi:uncharacterized protein LOC141714763 [Apium graveolens]|uniref:uncharacterized protein LOC141714763 n=1 Tax=Apium graveolens TaxID=4045 RepID=UPI003D7940FE